MDAVAAALLDAAPALAVAFGAGMESDYPRAIVVLRRPAKARKRARARQSFPGTAAGCEMMWMVHNVRFEVVV